MNDWLRPFLMQVVVIDVREQYLAIGTLAEVGDEHVLLLDCDLHDHREANSTKDVYLIETQKIGVRINRRRCTIPTGNLIAICRLADVAP
jgi:hypothetical protein